MSQSVIASPSPSTTSDDSAPPRTPISPDMSASSESQARGIPAGAQTKRRTARRANTAERRATHNAVERQRRETLNARFLDLATLLPQLAQIRRPSKSAIVNSCIANVDASRRHRMVAARELRLMKIEADALRRELNEWRHRARLPGVEEPERSDGFAMVLSGELETLPLDSTGEEEGEFNQDAGFGSGGDGEYAGGADEDYTGGVPNIDDSFGLLKTNNLVNSGNNEGVSLPRSQPMIASPTMYAPIKPEQYSFSQPLAVHYEANTPFEQEKWVQQQHQAQIRPQYPGDYFRNDDTSSVSSGSPPSSRDSGFNSSAMRYEALPNGSGLKSFGRRLPLQIDTQFDYMSHLSSGMPSSIGGLPPNMGMGNSMNGAMGGMKSPMSVTVGGGGQNFMMMM
ncbi:hypothetical protein FISHEDRAFT_56432 [Fistulina hepatica ATCC 64428]|uniref:BHLH domain-containing protein n=1 Tax=Fistulina hepatica ATCC 64428 TaxID=1128425 RepID=A0A0D7AIS9_9AGAR|nr:hypothetical protein FISHEDRAFT_56432 [Fistulina hepatica ATCC 64428]